MSAPRWLKRGPGRRARMTTCPKCTALLLVGLDADVAAITAEVDYRRLSTAGELLALTEGRTTYALAYAAGRYTLDPRTARGIIRAPADTVPVLPEHRCGAALPAIAIHPDRPLDRPPRGRTPDEPPF